MGTDYIIGWVVGFGLGLFWAHLIMNNKVKKLERKEGELFTLKTEIEEVKHWCAYDSPEIGFAMLHLQNKRNSVSGFRDKLRKGEFTFTNFKPQNNN